MSQFENWAPSFVSISLSEFGEPRFRERLAAVQKSTAFSPTRRWGRLALNSVLNLLGDRSEQILVNLLKRRSSETFYREPTDFFVSQLQRDGVLTIKANYPENKSYFIGFSFDIDYDEDQRALAAVCEKLTKNGLNASINVLTHGKYELSKSLLRDLKSMGHEIGLHGDDHNTSLAFLSPAKIRSKLRRALAEVEEFQVKGFRSPGLSYSANLIDALQELGFNYSSILTTGFKLYPSIEYPYVFRYPERDLFEVPLLIQDYNFFVNYLYSEQDALMIMKSMIHKIRDLSGVAVLNFHPRFLSNRSYFWSGLVDFVKAETETAYVNSMGRLLENHSGQNKRVE